MDPEKIQAVAVRPTFSRKEVQRFLGFANFYCKFMRNFSSVAAPLSALTSPKVSFQWCQSSENAFQCLKKLFTTAPVLTLPSVIVEVDTTSSGVAAVLSQRSGTDNKIHPFNFLSLRLSQAEKNYSVGDRELLAVKVALEEWSHWLEGTAQPFLAWTDHRNLEYLKSVKRLNAQQDWWVSRFQLCFVMFFPLSR